MSECIGDSHRPQTTPASRETRREPNSFSLLSSPLFFGTAWWSLPVNSSCLPPSPQTRVLSGNLPARRGEGAGGFVTRRQDFSSGSGAFPKPLGKSVLTGNPGKTGPWWVLCVHYFVKASKQPPSVGFIIPVVQMRKLRLREIMQFVQCHSHQ